MKINRCWLRTMGIFGILGGLILFAGDLLFYYDVTSTNLKLNMGNASDQRIMLSGVSALLATWFYLIGLGQVYHAFRPAKRKIRMAVVISLGGILVAYGIIHAAYVAIATAAKISVEYQLDLEKTTALASTINDNIRLLIYPVFAFLSIVFISQVWKRKTLYPRWIILFFPTILFFTQGLLSQVLTGGLWIIFVGGFYNLLLVIFFLASTIALWNPKPAF